MEGVKTTLSIYFTQSSDNKYVQYRLMSPVWSTVVSNWQGIDKEATINSNNLAISSDLYNKYIDSLTNIVKPVEIDGIRLLDYGLGDDGFFGQNETYKHSVFEVTEGERYLITNNSSSSLITFKYGFVTSSDYSQGGLIPLVAGTSIVNWTGNNKKFAVLNIPNGCTYIIFSNGGDNYNVVINKIISNIEFTRRLSAYEITSDLILNKQKIYEHSFIDFNGQSQSASLDSTACRTDFIPISNNQDLIVNGLYRFRSTPVASITCVALYDENRIFIESSRTSFKKYTKEYLETIGAKFYRCSFERKDYQNGIQYVYNYNPSLHEQGTIVRCLDLVKNDNNSITIDILYVYTKTGLLTVYADGNSENHTPKTFTFGNESGMYLLVLDKAGNIKQIVSNSAISPNEIVLLSYNSSLGFDGGGLLYPTLVNLELSNINNKINALPITFDNKLNDILSSVVGRNYQLYSGGGINKSNGTLISGSAYRTGFIKIEEGCDIYVKALTASAVTALALYSANRDNAFISAEQTSSIVYRSAKQLADVGAKYFKCSVDASQVTDNTWFICHAPITTLIKEVSLLSQRIDNLNSSQSNTDNLKTVAESLGNGLSPLDVICDNNGYELPTTKQVLDAQKRIEQLTQIKWTPLNAVPYNDGSYPANIEKTGLPYSSVKEYDKFIGFDVSVYTFMTAINNPYSLVYTENVGASTSSSAWGITYHGTNCACYYGLVCNVFALQCNGFDIPWNTHEHKWLSDNVFNMIKIYNQSAQGLQIGDIFWQQGHDMIIYKIKRSGTGDVTHVTIAESSGLAHVRPEITAEEFNSMLSTRVVYRSLERFKNKYVPSPFVAIRDEVITPYVYNDDICCFAGDRATFREGDIIAIDYNLKNVGAWTAMELYKNDTLLDTITIDTNEHYVNLTSRNLTYGSYKARMTDGTSYSDYTEFEIIQTTVSVDRTDTSSKVNFSSSNGNPIYIRICNIAGETYAMYKLTHADINNGYCIVDFTELNHQQYPSKALPSTAYVKVYFEGNFGRVTNQLVTL